MDSFTDYYAVLGVNTQASPSAIKAAFKKLALQYHPDVYKGEDAEERMRILLLAYQTLSDPASRRAYDARRSEHFLDGSARRVRVATETPEMPRRGSTTRTSSSTRTRPTSTFASSRSRVPRLKAASASPGAPTFSIATIGTLPLVPCCSNTPTAGIVFSRTAARS